MNNASRLSSLSVLFFICDIASAFGLILCLFSLPAILLELNDRVDASWRPRTTNQTLPPLLPCTLHTAESRRREEGRREERGREERKERWEERREERDRKERRGEEEEMKERGRRGWGAGRREERRSEGEKRGRRKDDVTFMKDVFSKSNIAYWGSIQRFICDYTDYSHTFLNDYFSVMLG